MCLDRSYEDAVSKLEATRIEWELRMQELCKVGTLTEQPLNNLLLEMMIQTHIKNQT